MRWEGPSLRTAPWNARLSLLTFLPNLIIVSEAEVEASLLKARAKVFGDLDKQRIQSFLEQVEFKKWLSIAAK